MWMMPLPQCGRWVGLNETNRVSVAFPAGDSYRSVSGHPTLRLEGEFETNGKANPANSVHSVYPILSRSHRLLCRSNMGQFSPVGPPQRRITKSLDSILIIAQPVVAGCSILDNFEEWLRNRFDGFMFASAATQSDSGYCMPRAGLNEGPQPMLFQRPT
jgi:hypothetical protein